MSRLISPNRIVRPVAPIAEELVAEFVPEEADDAVLGRPLGFTN